MHFNFNTKYYFISNFDTNTLNKQDRHTIIIYRNYNSKTINKTLILKLKQHCNKKGLKFFLSNNVKLALKLKLDGVYIPSFNSSFKHLSFIFNKRFELIGSAHNLKQIRIKELLFFELDF